MSNVSSKDGKNKDLREPAKSIKPGPFKDWKWGPAGAVIMSVTALVAAQLVIGGVFGIGLSAFGVPADRIDGWFNSIVGQSVMSFVSDVLTLSILWWYVVKRCGADWRVVGFWRKPQVKDATMAVFGFVIYFALLVALTGVAAALFNIDVNQKQELGYDNVIGAREKIMALISLVILPPIVEETIFRGFLFTGLRKKLNFAFAAILTSLLFGSLHLLASSSGPLWIAGIDTFAMSLVLCYLREKTGVLWASIAIHFAKNSIAFLFLYVFAT